MATFIFDGSNSQTITFDTDEDQVVFELEATEVASFVDTPQGATLTTTSGTTLVFAGLALVELANAEFFPEDLIQIGTNDDEDGLELIAGADGSFITALEGDDTVRGAEGDDVLFGNQDDDSLFGNGGSDRIYGGQGDDVVVVSNGADDDGVSSLVVGGLGQDTISVGAAVGAGAPAFTATGAYEGDVTIFGGNEAGDPEDEADDIDVILADESTAVIFGNGGADNILVTGNGDVSVYGGMDDDTIAVTADSSVIFAGLGEDTVTATLAAASDSAVIYGGNGAGDAADGDDDITVTMAAESDVTIFGNAGADDITVNSAGEGEVSVYGGQGDDTIDGSVTLGDDSEIYGGLGEDTISFVVSGEDVSVFGGNGSADAEDGDDEISLTVNAGAEVEVFGNGGDDEFLIGGLGEATVFGGAGDDFIEIDTAVEVELFGGIGSDTFAFGTGAQDGNATEENVDVISDINFDVDDIALEGQTITVAVDLTETTAANQEDIEDEATLADAADRALELASPDAITANTDVAVLFNYEGETYVAVGDAAVGNAEEADAIIQVTGFTGNFDTGAFDNTVTF